MKVAAIYYMELDKRKSFEGLAELIEKVEEPSTPEEDGLEIWNVKILGTDDIVVRQVDTRDFLTLALISNQNPQPLFTSQVTLHELNDQSFRSMVAETCKQYTEETKRLETTI
jgi:hypothetical protein